MLDSIVQDTRGGVELCPSSIAKFSETVGRPVRTGCSRHNKVKVSGNEEHAIFMWKTLSPTKVKNHDLSPVGFSHNPLNGLETLQSNNHCYTCNSHVASLILRPSYTTSKFSLRTTTQLTRKRVERKRLTTMLLNPS